MAAVAVAGILLPMLASGPAEASVPPALNAVECHYSTATLKWKDGTTRSGYAIPAANALSAWTVSPTPVTWSKVSTGANLLVTDGVWADPNLVGITVYNGQTDCNGGHYSIAPTSWFNRTVLDGYGSQARQSLMVHEVGHALGLGHSALSNCTAILYPYFSVFWTSCALLAPQSDDNSGINYLY